MVHIPDYAPRLPLVPKVSAALWERMREAKLRFGGGRVSMVGSFEVLVRGRKTESRRDLRSQSAALT